MALYEAASDLGLQKLRHYHSLVAIEAGDDAGPETETFIGPEGDNRESWQVSYERSKAIAAQRRLEYNVYLFKAVFRYIRVLDAGPSYRIFVWVPMLLQVFKLGAVLVLSERVSRLTFLPAIPSFLAWLVVELVMITVS